jgi:hypothetical protein
VTEKRTAEVKYEDGGQVAIDEVPVEIIPKSYVPVRIISIIYISLLTGTCMLFKVHLEEIICSTR